MIWAAEAEEKVGASLFIQFALFVQVLESYWLLHASPLLDRQSKAGCHRAYPLCSVDYDDDDD